MVKPKPELIELLVRWHLSETESLGNLVGGGGHLGYRSLSQLIIKDITESGEGYGVVLTIPFKQTLSSLFFRIIHLLRFISQGQSILLNNLLHDTNQARKYRMINAQQTIKDSWIHF